MIRAFLLAALVVSAWPAHAGDPFPPQLDATYIAEPAPIVQNGTTRLYYEMVLTNFAPASFVLEAIVASAGATKATFEDDALAAMIRPLGAKGAADRGGARTIAGGRSVIVFLELDLGRSAAPSSIAHTLRIDDDKGKPHDVVLAPIAVSPAQPLVVGAPLRGAWIAGDAVNDRPDAAHRRAVMVDNGHAWLAQRYAIDWVQYGTVDGKRTTWKGPEDKNESYFCWNKPVYSVAAGTVVAATDGMAENVPHSGQHVVALDFDNAAGNHAVVEIAPQRYVL